MPPCEVSHVPVPRFVELPEHEAQELREAITFTARMPGNDMTPQMSHVDAWFTARGRDWFSYNSLLRANLIVRCSNGQAEDLQTWMKSRIRVRAGQTVESLFETRNFTNELSQGEARFLLRALSSRISGKREFVNIRMRGVVNQLALYGYHWFTQVNFIRDDLFVRSCSGDVESLHIWLIRHLAEMRLLRWLDVGFGSAFERSAAKLRHDAEVKRSAPPDAWFTACVDAQAEIKAPLIFRTAQQA